MENLENEIDFTNINLESMGMFIDEQETSISEDPELSNEMRNLLQDCEIMHSSLSDFRARRKRVRDFYRGHQWRDLVDDPDNEGETVTEEELITRQGKIPMKNNQMRQLGKNLIGQYRENDYKPVAYPIKREGASLGDMMTNALQSVHRDNQLKEVDARMFEEFLLSGYIGWKSYVDWVAQKDLNDVIGDPTNPTRMFWNTDVADIRLKDLRIIGELHDMTIDEVVKVFANNDQEEATIREWYSGYGDPERHADYYGFLEEERFDSIDFYWSHDTTKVRVYEVWKKELTKKMFIHDVASGEFYESDFTEEEVQLLNEQRIQSAVAQGVDPRKVPLLEPEIKSEMCWYYYFLTPQGYVLAHGESPYEHQEHPYTIGLFPLIDGQVWGFMEDIIDQQKQINRMITLLDFMTGAGAKGVLMIPEDQIPEGWTVEDFAEEWVKFNGVISYKPSKNHNHMPHQVTANTQNAGAADMLQLNLRLLQEISGVNDAIQGHKPSSGTPASLYAQQTNNAAITNKDFYEFFYSVRKNRDFKLVQLIQQYYDEQRWINVSGNDYRREAMMYDPNKARDARFDIVVGVGNNNPVYRQIQDEWLFKFWEAGGIGLDTLLENSALPFADKLLESMKRKEEELQKAIASGQVPNPEAQALMQQAIEGNSQEGQRAA